MPEPNNLVTSLVITTTKREYGRLATRPTVNRFQIGSIPIILKLELFQGCSQEERRLILT